MPIEYCPHGYPLRYSLNCEGCIDGNPDYIIPESELPKQCVHHGTALLICGCRQQAEDVIELFEELRKEAK